MKFSRSLLGVAMSLVPFLGACGSPGENVGGVSQATDLFEEEARPTKPLLSFVLSNALTAGKPTMGGVAGIKSGSIGANVLCSGDTTGMPQNEPAIARDPSASNTVLIGSNDYRNFPIDVVPGIYRSTDGGATFSDGVLSGLTVGHGGSFDSAGDPSIACSFDGHCYYSVIAFDFGSPASAIAIFHSPNGGQTWSTPKLAASDNDFAIFNDKSWITVDNSNGPRKGTVYVTWTRFAVSPDGSFAIATVLASSTDHGATWSAPHAVNPNALTINLGSRPIVDKDGDLFVVYENFDDPNRDRQIVQRSTDGGRTFAAPVVAGLVTDTPSPMTGASYRTNSFPAVATNPVTGALHLAWNDNSRGVSDILVSSSADQGKTWSAPSRANDTPLVSTAQHVFPAIACGPTGACGISFYSTRNDPNNVLLDVYYSSLRTKLKQDHSKVETKAGPNVRVTNFSSDPSVQFGGTFFGDYTDLTIDATTAHPAWTDTRVKQPFVNQQDIFSAAIQLDEVEDAD
jgi:hypothetical protein